MNHAFPLFSRQRGKAGKRLHFLKGKQSWGPLKSLTKQRNFSFNLRHAHLPSKEGRLLNTERSIHSEVWLE